MGGAHSFRGTATARSRRPAGAALGALRESWGLARCSDVVFLPETGPQMSAQEHRSRSPEWGSIGPWAALGVLSSAIVLTTIGLALQAAVGVYMTPFAYELAQSGAILADSIVGLVIVRRLPGHPIAWILLASGLNWGLRQAFFGYAAQGLATPHTGFAPAIAALIYWADTATDLVIITWFCVLFPDGRPVSARWGSLRWTCRRTPGRNPRAAPCSRY